VIDVAVGKVDVVFSPEPQMLIVDNNDLLVDPSFNIVTPDDDGPVDPAAKDLFRLRSAKPDVKMVEHVFTTDPPDDVELDEDYLINGDNFFDDGPKFQGSVL
jgi:hypothetical protein